MDATNASDLDLDQGVLPGHQAVVCCRNSVKAEDIKTRYRDEIRVFLILDMHVRNKKLGISSLYLA